MEQQRTENQAAGLESESLGQKARADYSKIAAAASQLQRDR